jgi:hypothetical protein
VVKQAAWLSALILLAVLAILVWPPPAAKEAQVIPQSAEKETPSIAGPGPTAIPSPSPSGVSDLSIQSAAASDAIHLAITNVRDTLFTASWLTDEAETGQVQLADGTVYDDARGSGFVGRTHYVTVAGLLANQQYTFDVISRDKRYDRAGTHWIVNTGTALAPRTPDQVFGKVRNLDGSNATDVIVFSIIDRVQQGVGSAPLSTLVAARDDGVFALNLGEARASSDPTRYFEYAISSDRYMNNCVTLQAVGERGAGLLSVDAGDEGLRAKDLGQWLVIRLVASTD